MSLILVAVAGLLLRSKMGRFILVVFLLAISVPVYFLYLKSPPPLPDVDLDEWWGPQQMKNKQDVSVKPYKVEFSQVMIRDLKDRIKDRHPLTPPLEGVSFEYGFNSRQLADWLKYWAEDYPFSEREKFFNKYPQYTTNIQGLDIHFIRVKPEVPKGVEVLPVLLLHGWPGSVREFYEAIPHLTAVSSDRDFALEVIIPSLPGYGFSSAAVRPGLGADKVAVVLRNLMQRLGFKAYYVQGGDWGAFITSIMSTLFPKEVLGHHTNLAFLAAPQVTLIRILGSIYPPLVVNSEVQDRIYPLSTTFGRIMEETGYFHIQSTKPDTVGVALTDSPTGLAAYILEKFSTWTNFTHISLPDGGLTRKYSKDQLIDNLMVYWSTKSITTSMRLYSETFNKRFQALNLDQIPTPVPTWCLQARFEVAYFPPWMLRFKYPNLLGETVLHEGGHFFAFEMPREFASDVIKAIQTFRGWHKTQEKTEL